YAVVPGTAGASPGGDRAGTAQWRRKEPSGRNQRTDERSVYRGDHAVCFSTERDADVERPDSVAGLDHTAETNRVSGGVYAGTAAPSASSGQALGCPAGKA